MTFATRLILFKVLSLYCILAVAQQDPFFMPFIGDAYELSYDEVCNSKFRFHEKILEYEKIAKIEWKEIKIKKTKTDIPLPEVDGYNQFGLFLKSEMIIKEEGCYEFALISDDGSLFWIDDKIIVDNDGMHKMRLRKDSLMLKAGKYPIKLWYYQGLPHQYGFIFDGRYISETCPNGQDLDNFGNPADADKITLTCQHLFEYDSYELKEEVQVSLDSLILNLQESDFKSITFNGYTCNEGTDEYNNNLSKERAAQLEKYFLNKLIKPGVIFRSIGHGSKNPVASNASEKNRILNRRVEIIIE